MAKESNKSFVLRVDAATMDALERWSDDEFRSINGQLQWIIADALRRSGRIPRGTAKASASAVDGKASAAAAKTAASDAKAWESSGASPACAQSKTEK